MQVLPICKKSYLPDSWDLESPCLSYAGGVFTFDHKNDASQSSWASQKVVLNQAHPALILAGCESRSENVSGNNAYEYSFLLKIVFMDGTTNYLDWVPFNDGSLHYADYAAFSKGSHDWEKRTLSLVYPKPVKEIEFRMLFLKHGGKAMFRQPFVEDFSKDGKASFDAQPIDTSAKGIEGYFYRELTSADQDFLPFAHGEPDGIAFEDTSESAGDVVHYTVRLNSDGMRDRALTLYYAMDVDGGDITYLPDMLHEIPADMPKDYFDVTPWSIGANGLCSKFPFATIDDGKELVSIGFSPASPVFGRAAYNGALKQLYIAFDIAFTPEKPDAEFSFVVFKTPNINGFRAALAHYYSIFPDAYDTRIHEQGNWMAFVKISTVEGWEDFYFRFKEGVGEEKWDKEHNMLTFRYTEPMTCWVQMDPENPPKSDEDLIRFISELEKTPEKPQYRKTQILKTSAMQSADGKDIAIIMDRPWCHGAVWSINSMPGIEGEITDFKTKWNNDVIKEFYTEGADQEIAGEYIDSAEGYVTADISHRRDHFNASRLPLSFAKNSHVPGIFKGTVVYEYVKALRDEMLPRGKYVMGNGTPGAMWFLPTLMDIAGTETDWCIEGKWTPMTVEEFCFRRSACAGKPYCFLMNTNFDRFTDEMVEKYMRRSMVFGMFPSFFSANAATGHYFTQPSLYNRHRSFFKKYMPIIKRVAEAGWQPVTEAAATSEKVHLERFGEDILTVLNDSMEPVKTKIDFTHAHSAKAWDLVTDREFVFQGDSLELDLAPEDVMVLEY